MTIGDFKLWVGRIPKSMENADIVYVDFFGHSKELKLYIGDEGAYITSGHGEDFEFLDEREADND